MIPGCSSTIRWPRRVAPDHRYGVSIEIVAVENAVFSLAGHDDQRCRYVDRSEAEKLPALRRGDDGRDDVERSLAGTVYELVPGQIGDELELYAQIRLISSMKSGATPTMSPSLSK